MSLFKMTSGYKEKKCNSICISFENLRVCQKNEHQKLSGGRTCNVSYKAVSGERNEMT